MWMMMIVVVIICSFLSMESNKNGTTHTTTSPCHTAQTNAFYFQQQKKNERAKGENNIIVFCLFFMRFVEVTFFKGKSHSSLCTSTRKQSERIILLLITTMAFRDNIFYCRLEHKSKVLKVFFIVLASLLEKKYDDENACLQQHSTFYFYLRENLLLNCASKDEKGRTCLNEERKTRE